MISLNLVQFSSPKLCGSPLTSKRAAYFTKFQQEVKKSIFGGKKIVLFLIRFSVIDSIACHNLLDKFQIFKSSVYKVGEKQWKNSGDEQCCLRIEAFNY